MLICVTLIYFGNLVVRWKKERKGNWNRQLSGKVDKNDGNRRESVNVLLLVKLVFAVEAGSQHNRWETW